MFACFLLSDPKSLATLRERRRNIGLSLPGSQLIIDFPIRRAPSADSVPLGYNPDDLEQEYHLQANNILATLHCPVEESTRISLKKHHTLKSTISWIGNDLVLYSPPQRIIRMIATSLIRLHVEYKGYRSRKQVYSNFWIVISMPQFIADSKGYYLKSLAAGLRRGLRILLSTQFRQDSSSQCRVFSTCE